MTNSDIARSAVARAAQHAPPGRYAAPAGHAPPARRAVVKGLALRLIAPVLVCLGLGVTYLAAFQHPQPHRLEVAVVGTTPEAKAVAEAVRGKAGDSLDVTTVATRQAAVEQLTDRHLVGAFLPDPAVPELLVAKAGSSATANATEAVFRALAGHQGTALKVTDIAPLTKEDPSGGGLFFLLIALTVGSQVAVLVLAPAAGALGMRVRAALGLAASFAISAVGLLLAGPVFEVVDHSYPAVGGMCLLYSAGVVAVGLGLQTFLKHFTPLALMGLFVMLNLTSAGGLMGPELQNGFFRWLHSCWNGAGFVEGGRGLLYFGGAGLDGHLLTLGLWLAAGVVLMLLAARSEKRRTR
ncbi:hypothetical protein WN990_20915 [Kitasatospora purpeofusca]|uniref:hypothetical protein n=1 Tax=Kitasatospora purpeofusca TaxID=67352 RepID=UPI0030F33F78